MLEFNISDRKSRLTIKSKIVSCFTSSIKAQFKSLSENYVQVRQFSIKKGLDHCTINYYNNGIANSCVAFIISNRMYMKSEIEAMNPYKKYGYVNTEISFLYNSTKISQNIVSSSISLSDDDTREFLKGSTKTDRTRIIKKYHNHIESQTSINRYPKNIHINYLIMVMKCFAGLPLFRKSNDPASRAIDDFDTIALRT